MFTKRSHRRTSIFHDRCIGQKSETQRLFGWRQDAAKHEAGWAVHPNCSSDHAYYVGQIDLRMLRFDRAINWLRTIRPAPGSLNAHSIGAPATIYAREDLVVWAVLYGFEPTCLVVVPPKADGSEQTE